MSDEKPEAASEGGIGQSASTAGLASECSSATEERYLRETLAMLHESYAKAAKPYIDRLVAINAMRQPAPMIVTLEQAQALGLMPANVELRGEPLAASPSQTQG